MDTELTEEEDLVEAILNEVNPRVKPGRVGQKSPYYVSEADLYAGVMHLYETGEFPEALAADLLKMCRRILSSRRFHGYPDTVKEEMVSSASIKVCRQLELKKYDPTRGSKVYSWATRVIMNEYLQTIRREEVRQKRFDKLVENSIIEDSFEYIETPKTDQY